MSDALNALRNELTTWYASLDSRTQGFFEAIYAEAPAVVASALGGGQVTSDEIREHATLASMLGADAGSSVTDLVPYIGAAAGIVVNPSEPLTGEEFVVRWADQNYGSPSPGHVDDYAIYDDSDNVLVSGRVDVPALDHDAHSDIEWKVPSVLTRPGAYVVRVFHNAEGVDAAYAPFAKRARGIRTTTEMRFEVRPAPVVASSGTVDIVAVTAAAELLRGLSAVDRARHDLALTDALAAYANAFRNGPDRFANRLARLDRVVGRIRERGSASEFVDTPAQALVLWVVEEALAERASPDEVFNALLDLVRELEEIQPELRSADDEDDDEEPSAPSPTPAQPHLQAAPGVPDPYVNLAAETGGGEAESYTSALPSTSAVSSSSSDG
jgi:hypothetical protein